MIKHFYSYHVEIESVEIEIDSLNISDAEKKHLKNLAESQIHNSILENLLSELSGEDKIEFIKKLNTKDHEKMWDFLREKINDVEEKIVKAGSRVKNELIKDIIEEKNKLSSQS